MKKIYGIFYAILSSTAFGFMPIFAKVAYNNGSDTLNVLILRFLFAALILLGYFLISGINFRLNKKQILRVSLIGILGYCSTTLTLFLSYNYISVGLSTTLHFIYPTVVIFLAFIIYKEKPSLSKVVSLILSIIGIYALIGFGDDKISLKGVVLSIISGFCYAGCILAMANKEIKKIDSRVLTFYLALSACLFLTIFGKANNKLNFTFNLNIFLAILGISLISTVIAIITFVKGLKIIGPSSSAILSTFEPIVSVIMGSLILGEKITPTIAVGGALIILSVIIVSWSKENKEEPQDKLHDKKVF